MEDQTEIVADNSIPHPELPVYIRQVPQAKIDEVRLAYIAATGSSLSMSDDELDETIAALGEERIDKIVAALK